MESMVYRRKWPLFIFLVPAFAALCLFLFYPFLQSVIDSFYNIPALGTSRDEYIGLFNYKRLFTDPMMRTALLNTGKTMIVTLVFQVGLALLLAMMVDSIKRGAQFFRVVYFFPIVISAAALGLLFNLLVLYDGGMINQLLVKLGGSAVDWKSRSYAFTTMMAPVMWQYVGFYFVILVTGLNNIPEELYEAASIDGAMGIQRIRYVTLPMLYNVIVTCATLAITGALKVFDLPWIMFPRGVPLGETYLTSSYMYDRTFNHQDVSYGSTIAILIVVLGVASAQITNAIFKPRDY